MKDDDFMRVLKARRSIRRFLDKPVPQEILHKLIEAATWAPSAGNRQNWMFTVITSPEVKEQMAAEVGACWQEALEKPGMKTVADMMQTYSRHFDWFSTAPVVLVLSAKRPESFMEEMFGSSGVDVAGTRISVAMAAENLMLAVHAFGLGSCCLTAPLAAQEQLKDLLGLGLRQDIVCVIALGYADENPPEPSRKAVDAVVRYVA